MQATTKRANIRQFQSLFFWNSRPDQSLVLCEEVVDLFQSLFFWNSRPDFRAERHTQAIGKFQSLFFWNSRPDSTPFRAQVWPTTVSILVFLELAPGQEYEGGLWNIALVSILVFLELAPGQSGALCLRIRL